ncbi:MAG TPA: caspase family protein [Actinocrinis sp.]|jgi:uncharacterized caspase-like protein|uniref:caspase, EACC1-associated type n=1 Tax=Actinocrinis sp. TaxID=1920516 RepID=UPI002DDD4CF0|nr:caspase family protein [Actinocrinis sp.]HEV3172737.1 caspase family protein [Actinocrinis sp.]
MASVDSARAEGRRLALVIANGVYEPDSGLTALRGPEIDARRLSAVLEDPVIGGFAVDAVIDRPSSEVRSKLEVFLAEARRHDLVVVYLSCHGLLSKRDQTLYFAALDTRRAALRTTATQARLLTDLLDECRALRKVLILDCCYSGAFARGAKSGGVDVGAELIGSGQGLVVLTSSRAVQESYEDEGEDGAFTSVFTAGLVDGLSTGEADRDRDGWISLDEAYHYAREYVQERRPEQNPQRWMVEAEGVIYLARSTRAADPVSSAQARTASTSPRPVSPAPPRPVASIRLTRVMTGHRGHVHDNAFSPDGALLATVGGDGTARVWDCATGDLKNSALILSPLMAVAFSPDGSQFATGGVSTSVHMRHAHDAGFAAALKGASDAIRALAYSPDGALLAAACEDGTVCLWDPRTARTTRTSETRFGPASAIAFSHDGQTLAAARGDGDVLIWNPASGARLQQLTTDGDETLGVAFGGDGTRLFIGGRGIVEVWDPGAAHRVGELVAPAPSLAVSVQVSPNGQLVAGAGERGELWLWDALKGDLLATQDAHTGGASAVAFHPKGRMLCTVGADARVCLWELSATGG